MNPIFVFKHLQSSVEQGMVTKMIVAVLGQPCQLRLDPPLVGKFASEMSYQSGAVQESPKHLSGSDPGWYDVFEEWEEITRVVCHQPHGVALGSALKHCQPQSLNLEKTPGILRLQTSNESAAALLKDAADSGSVSVTLLPALGRVYRVQVMLL